MRNDVDLPQFEAVINKMLSSFLNQLKMMMVLVDQASSSFKKPSFAGKNGGFLTEDDLLGPQEPSCIFN
jgi:hypothetical protein